MSGTAAPPHADKLSETINESGWPYPVRMPSLRPGDKPPLICCVCVSPRHRDLPTVHFLKTVGTHINTFVRKCRAYVCRTRGCSTISVAICGDSWRLRWRPKFARMSGGCLCVNVARMTSIPAGAGAPTQWVCYLFMGGGAVGG